MLCKVFRNTLKTTLVTHTKMRSQTIKTNAATFTTHWQALLALVKQAKLLLTQRQQMPQMLQVNWVSVLLALKPLVFKSKDWRSEVGLDDPPVE